MYCATSLSSAPPFFSRKRRNETSPLSLLSSSKTSFLHFLTDRTAISTIMPSSGVPVKRPYNCVLPASMGSATPVEGSTRKNMCHLPWRFLHVSDVFEIHRRLKIAGRNHISRCHHLDGHRRTSVPAGGSLRTQPQPRQRVAASHATVHVARIVPSGMLAEAASRTMRKGDANNRPPFAESSGNTKIMREKCGRYVGVNRLYSWGEDAESHFVQNGFRAKVPFSGLIFHGAGKFFPRSPFETLHRSHLPYFPEGPPASAIQSA